MVLTVGAWVVARSSHIGGDFMPFLGRDVCGRHVPIVFVLFQQWVDVFEKFLTLNVTHVCIIIF